MKFHTEFLRPIDGRQLARYNPDKTISVPVVFGFPRFSHLGNRGQFVVKLIAPRGVWKRWATAFEANRPVPFKTVKTYLSRTRKADVKELSDYAEARPGGLRIAITIRRTGGALRHSGQTTRGKPLRVGLSNHRENPPRIETYLRMDATLDINSAGEDATPGNSASGGQIVENRQAQQEESFRQGCNTLDNEAAKDRINRPGGLL